MESVIHPDLLIMRESFTASLYDGGVTASLHQIIFPAFVKVPSYFSYIVLNDFSCKLTFVWKGVLNFDALLMNVMPLAEAFLISCFFNEKIYLFHLIIFGYHNPELICFFRKMIIFKIEVLITDI